MKQLISVFLFVLIISITSSYCEESARFKDNGDGTITDTSTGLMWIKYPEPMVMTWQNAADLVKKIFIGSYSDWRIPTQDELWSLHKGMKLEDNPSDVLAKNGFIFKPYYFWSSTACVGPDCKDINTKDLKAKCASNSNCMMTVSMGDYGIIGFDKSEKMFLLPVRTVKNK